MLLVLTTIEIAKGPRDMDFVERLEVLPLGTAVRRLDYDPRPEHEPPDDLTALQRAQMIC